MGRSRPTIAVWGGVGAVGVAVLVLLAPLTSAYTFSGWSAQFTASITGSTGGSGANAPTPGLPTAGGSPVVTVFGFTSGSGPAVGWANYFQQGGGWALPTFSAWKASGATYHVDIHFAFSMAANDVVATANCAKGGSANATAVLFLQFALKDTTTGTYVVPLSPSTGAYAWAPWTASCSGSGTASQGNPGMSISGIGNLTSTALTLTAGNTYQIESAILAIGSAYTTAASATASATFSFGAGNYAEIVNTNVY